MKYSLLALALVFGTANATEPSPFEGRHTIKPIVYTECQGGHLFIIVASQYGVATQEIFQDTNDMVPKPIECGEEE